MTRKKYLDFEVDKLTKSIENAVTGDSFQTEITNLTNTDVKQAQRKKGWLFDWKKELKDNSKEVYKLTIQNNTGVLQGLISLKIEANYVYISLIESAPFNRGRNKMYLGVSGNLVAHACRLSFQKGFKGFVSFHSKTKLIGHYEKSLGAYHFGGHLMILEDKASQQLVDKYFKN